MKRLRSLLASIYMYTALLPVHVLAMHGKTHGEHAHSHHQDEDCTCDHTHDEDHEEHGDMELCMTQSFGTLNDSSLLLQNNERHGYPIPEGLYTIETGIYDGYIPRLHDPGREEYSGFLKFIHTHYGEVVLHC